MQIEEAIYQTTFINEYHKAHLNILLTASWSNKKTSDLLKPFNITWQQFNILRILRGMAPKPATVKLLTTRMIDKMSNASRLVEKLRSKGLVERVLDASDRRKVKVTITAKGLDLLEEASRIIEENQLDPNHSAITIDEAQTLNRILDKMRSQ